MNPRSRRLLIPGLLVALLVVVLVASIRHRADGAEPGPPVASTIVSRIGDPRITESSGLAISRTHDDLAYTVNDSGNAAVVYAVRVSTGRVVGTTTIRDATWLDTEAMALSGGTLWVADTGDNAYRRTDAALYTMPEPGPGDHVVTPRRYPVRYDEGPQDVEAIAVKPGTGKVLLLGKDLTGGVVYRLPDPLRPNAENIARATELQTPVLTTDATYTDDGKQVLLRNYIMAQLRDADSWKLLRTDVLPNQPQGETIALEPSGRSYLIGSEGEGSALMRIAFHRTAASPTPKPTPSVASQPARAEQDGSHVPVGVIGALGGIVALAAIGWRASRRS